MAKLACFLVLLALGQTFAARSSGSNSPDMVVRDFGFDTGSSKTGSASRGSSISSSRGSIWDDADDDFSTPKIQAWTGGVVPYEISSEISSTNAAALKRMFQDISDKTCVRFVPRTRSDKNYALIQSGNKCSAPLGMSTGTSSSSKTSLLSSSGSGTPSNIILGQSCFTTTRVARRILNLLGIPHETSRPDRDDFVEINFSNLRPGYDKQVKQVARSAWLPGVLDVPYDLQSVTQYTDDDVAANTNNWAIRAKSRRNVQLGGDTFSTSDWSKIRKAYNCPSSSFSG